MFDEEKEKILNWLSTKLEQDYQRKTLAKLFAVGVVGNILSWLIAFYTPSIIGKFIATLVNIEGKIGYYLLIVPFSFAFLMSLSICKLRINQIETVVNQKKEFLVNYFETLQANDFRVIFLISAMFGALNCILLVFVITM